MPLGGGTSAQKKHGIGLARPVVCDLTDWSVVEPNGFPDYRYNDREIVRAFADNSVATYEWLVAHGVIFADKAPDERGGNSVGNSVPREMHCRRWTGRWRIPASRPIRGAARPIPSATASCVRWRTRREGRRRIRLEHKMTALHREDVARPRDYGGKQRRHARHRRAEGGDHRDRGFDRQRQFPPHVGSAPDRGYCGLAGMPWSDQDASGEIAAMAIGASLWGIFNQTGEFGYKADQAGYIGNQYGYRNLQWMPGSSVFDRARATGLLVHDWQNVITVNMLGERFYDETGPAFTTNDFGSISHYTQGSYRNARNITWKPNNWLNAAMAGIGDSHNGGGPIWAIFDADAVTRENWVPAPPHVDIAGGFFFSADTLGDLARKIVMTYQRVPMPPEGLEKTVARYNAFVEAGKDEDFGKPGRVQDRHASVPCRLGHAGDP